MQGEEKMKKLKAIVIGAGNRGLTYSRIMKMMPEKFEIVGVAEPHKYRRNNLKEMYNIPEENCFESWEGLLELGRIADFAIIATMDQDHYAPAMKAISLKYDLLLEKPVAPTARECREIAKAAKENKVKVLVCHVLRYAPLYVKLKQMIDGGEIGDIISITHEENVGNIHQSHSFVRGNWGNSRRSSPMLLQKSCHDLDILQWLVSKKCKKVQSFGALTYFKEKNAPAGSPERCIEGCPNGDKCPYNALKLYLNSNDDAWFRASAASVIERDHFIQTDEDVKKALLTTQYGKCIFKCDNDVIDHQTVNMLFEDDVTAVFNLAAFNKGGRFTHIMGTKGEIHASGNGIELYTFEDSCKSFIDLASDESILKGHGGGDEGLIASLYDYFALDIKSASLTEIDISAENHMIVFAAERSRLEGGVVEVEE